MKSPIASSLSMVRAAISAFQNTSALRRSRATVAFWIESPVITAMPSPVATATAIVPAECPGAATISTPGSSRVPSSTTRMRSSYRVTTASIQSGHATSLRCGRRTYRRSSGCITTSARAKMSTFSM